MCEPYHCLKMSQPRNLGFEQLSLQQQWDAVRRGSPVIMPHRRGSRVPSVSPARGHSRWRAELLLGGSGSRALWEGHAGGMPARGRGQQGARGR